MTDTKGLRAELQEAARALAGEGIGDDIANLFTRAVSAIERLEVRADAAEAHRDQLAEALEISTFAPWLREWCKRRFGKWITHNTAKGALTELRARRARETLASLEKPQSVGDGQPDEAQEWRDYDPEC